MQHCVSVYKKVLYYSLTTRKGNETPFYKVLMTKLIGKPGSHFKRKRVQVGHLMPTFSGSGIPPFLSFSGLPNFQGLTVLFFFAPIPFYVSKQKVYWFILSRPILWSSCGPSLYRDSEYFTIFRLRPEKTCT